MYQWYIRYRTTSFPKNLLAWLADFGSRFSNRLENCRLNFSPQIDFAAEKRTNKTNKKRTNKTNKKHADGVLFFIIGGESLSQNNAAFGLVVSNTGDAIENFRLACSMFVCSMRTSTVIGWNISRDLFHPITVDVRIEHTNMQVERLYLSELTAMAQWNAAMELC